MKKIKIKKIAGLKKLARDDDHYSNPPSYLNLDSNVALIGTRKNLKTVFFHKTEAA